MICKLFLLHSFDIWAPVKAVRIPKDCLGNNRGIAFVEFEELFGDQEANIDMLEQVITQTHNNQKLRGRPLSVRLANNEDGNYFKNLYFEERNKNKLYQEFINDEENYNSSSSKRRNSSDSNEGDGEEKPSFYDETNRRYLKNLFLSECSICQNQIKTQTDICESFKPTGLFCGHVFHIKCIKQWFASGPVGNSRSCPNCKAEIHHPIRVLKIEPSLPDKDFEILQAALKNSPEKTNWPGQDIRHQNEKYLPRAGNTGIGWARLVGNLT